MGNIFDPLQDSVFDTVTTTMGYPASWQPTAGGEALTGEVLFKGPTAQEGQLDANYNPLTPIMEYKAGVFAGLKESVDSNNTEVVQIDTIGEFYVRSVSKKFDGRNFEAMLEKKEV